MIFNPDCSICVWFTDTNYANSVSQIVSYCRSRNIYCVIWFNCQIYLSVHLSDSACSSFSWIPPNPPLLITRIVSSGMACSTICATISSTLESTVHVCTHCAISSSNDHLTSGDWKTKTLSAFDSDLAKLSLWIPDFIVQKVVATPPLSISGLEMLPIRRSSLGNWMSSQFGRGIWRMRR